MENIGLLLLIMCTFMARHFYSAVPMLTSRRLALINAPHSFRVDSGPRHGGRLLPLQAYSDATPSLYLRRKGPKDNKILRRVSRPMKKSTRER